MTYLSAILLCLSFFTVSCSVPFLGNAEKIEHNHISDEAHKFDAKYGVDYILKGDRVAQYPDFDLSLSSVETKSASNSQIFIYEISSKDGYETRHISIDTSTADKKHFYVENAHFYYHSNGAYSINIYMPPQLLAKH